MSCERCESYKKDAEEADRDRREAKAHLINLLEQREKEILRLKTRIEELAAKSTH